MLFRSLVELLFFLLIDAPCCFLSGWGSLLFYVTFFTDLNEFTMGKHKLRDIARRSRP